LENYVPQVQIQDMIGTRLAVSAAMKAKTLSTNTRHHQKRHPRWQCKAKGWTQG